jgi:STE24 endopeptidase
VALIGSSIGGEVGGWVALGGFVASGALMVWRPVETFLARAVLRLRRPTRGELAALTPAWRSVCRRAGVDPARFTLWVEPTDSVNALAAAGHTVAVTTEAIRVTQPDEDSADQPNVHLAGVLAHELGHHMGSHALIGLLITWYQLPARLLVFALMLITRALLFLTSTISSLFGRLHLAFIALILGWAVPVLGVAFVAMVLYTIHPAALLILLFPLASAWFGRQSEKRADRFAVSLGYGPALIDVLEYLQEQEDDDDQSTLRERLFATHPSLASRLVALEKLEAAQPALR